ncbi:MAG: hypothetical protein GQ529_00065, partial [Methyloprofundus sp.]|nr:hypothetical protein [Methyloprofundus sp.]
MMPIFQVYTTFVRLSGRGTGVQIWNSVFTGFGSSCLMLDGEATYKNAGTPDVLSGQMTIVH